MKNQADYKLSLVGKFFMAVVGLLILGLSLLTGAVDVLPGNVYSSEIDPDEMYADKYRNDKSDFISQGFSCLKKEQFADAITAFNKALDLEPGKALTYVARGSAYFRLDQFDNAISDYNKAIEIDPRFVAAYQNLGSVYYRKGQFDKAISEYNRAIEINPDYVIAYVDRGNTYQYQGRYDEAEKLIQEVIRIRTRDLAPDHPELLDAQSELERANTVGRY